jgi:hypothetical protein
MYNKSHTEDSCDRCNKKVGLANLKFLPFLYKDMEDDMHPDMGDGYRSYKVCDICFAMEERIRLRKERGR